MTDDERRAHKRAYYHARRDRYLKNRKARLEDPQVWRAYYENVIKKWREENEGAYKAYHKEYNKAYYKKNRAKILARQKELRDATDPS